MEISNQLNLLISYRLSKILNQQGHSYLYFNNYKKSNIFILNLEAIVNIVALIIEQH